MMNTENEDGSALDLNPPQIETLYVVMKKTGKKEEVFTLGGMSLMTSHKSIADSLFAIVDLFKVKDEKFELIEFTRSKKP